jgi:sarcosine/dimethylglycine N-methyltransferase
MTRHYGRPGLGDAILAGLRAAGKDPDRPAPEDLAPVDQFHIGGRDATLELAKLAGLAPGLAVLDVGGGLGGPARTLAGDFGARVTVLDLTEEYCRVGEDLTRRTGLADRVSFRHGDALAPPFPEASFDVVWTQHSSMNVEDKERLYESIRHVLRPGGRLALHEVMAGPVSGVHFPVPWSPDGGFSFLRSPEAIRGVIAGLGLRETAWVDVSPAALAWFRERVAAARSATAPPPLGLHLLLGPAAGPMFANMLRNLEERRIVVIQAVWLR